MCTGSLRCFNGLRIANKFLAKHLFSTSSGQLSKSNLSSFQETQRKKIKSTLYYVIAGGVVVVGLSYAAVPLYRMFCQAYSYGGTTSGHDASKVETMLPVMSKPFKIRFNADTATSMRWKFKPQQSEITVSYKRAPLSDYINAYQL